MKAEQRDGAEYEFTTVLDIIHDGHFAVASKDRTGLFADKDPQKISEKTGQALLDWLESGVVIEQFQISPQQEADLIAAIESASNGQELKSAADACKAAKVSDDKQASERIMSAYQTKYEQLSSAYEKHREAA